MKRLLTLSAAVALLAATALALWQPASAQPLRLATTTSTDNSGLLKHLLPKFEARHGIRVQVIAVGSGKALKLGENGDVDVVLAHARADEDRFMQAGHGVVRRDVMYNDFVVVGPAADPAKIRGERDVLRAFQRIAASGTRFISRGDDSGTDKMEKSYWKALGVQPKGDWYVSAGQGMGEVLAMAGEMQGYTLSDRATFVPYRARTDLAILVEGDSRLHNPYGVMAVNPAKGKHINQRGAQIFINWLTSAEGQQAIAAFRVDGQQLFFPNAAGSPPARPGSGR